VPVSAQTGLSGRATESAGEAWLQEKTDKSITNIKKISVHEGTQKTLSLRGGGVV
jgi:hypothetical protein